MQIASELMEVVVVEAHSKASNVLTLPEITAFAEDPTYERPLGLHPGAPAGGLLSVGPGGGRRRGLRGRAVRVRGVGWANDTPALDSRAWGEARYARLAGEIAYLTVGIRAAQPEIDFSEVADTFA